MSQPNSDVEGSGGAISPELAEAQFQNLLLRAGMVRVELEMTLINAGLTGGFNRREFEEWCDGEIRDDELRDDRLEFYREIVAARSTFDECIEVARAAVAGESL